MLDSDYNSELDANFNNELVGNINNELIGYSNNIEEESKKSNITTENYIIPIFASIGATTIFVGCSCAFGYYMHVNGIEIDSLPLPMKYYLFDNMGYY